MAVQKPATNSSARKASRGGSARRTSAAKKGSDTTKTTRAAARRSSVAKPAATPTEIPKTPAAQVQDLVERVALTYVGAILAARDRVAEGYAFLTETYGDAESVERQLKRFERRGTAGRNRFERELKR